MTSYQAVVESASEPSDSDTLLMEIGEVICRSLFNWGI